MATNQAAVIAANHFGLGARPGELAHISDDPRGWLIAQLNGERTLPASIAQLPSSTQVFQTQAEFLRAKKLAKQTTTTADADVDPQRRVIRDLYLAQVAARYQVATQAAQRVGGRALPLEMAQRSLGNELSEHTQMAITNAADAAQGIILWLVSPEFQRR